MSPGGFGESTKKHQQKTNKKPNIRRIKNTNKNRAFQTDFNTIMECILEDFQLFLPEDIEIEYHVVVFNYNDNQRYTIVESPHKGQQKGTSDVKKLDFGVVGLFPKTNFNSEFFLAQASYSKLSSHIYKLDKAGVVEVNSERRKKLITAAYSAEEVEGKEQEATDETISDEKNELKWEQTKTSGDYERHTFAIAAMLLKRIEKTNGEEEIDDEDDDFEEKEKYLGAVSLDFVKYDPDYPNFSFRQAEVELIYQRMKIITQFIEKTLDFDFHNEMNSLVKTAGGE